RRPPPLRRSYRGESGRRAATVALSIPHRKIGLTIIRSCDGSDTDVFILAWAAAFAASILGGRPTRFGWGTSKSSNPAGYALFRMHDRHGPRAARGPGS